VRATTPDNGSGADHHATAREKRVLHVIVVYEHHCRLHTAP
jgi:hypothetical protein